MNSTHRVATIRDTSVRDYRSILTILRRVPSTVYARIAIQLMIVVRNHDGSYLISDVIDGYRVARRYIGHTKRYAQQLFRQEIKQLNKGDK
jgi:hypothetical protein